MPYASLPLEDAKYSADVQKSISSFFSPTVNIYVDEAITLYRTININEPMPNASKTLHLPGAAFTT